MSSQNSASLPNPQSGLSGNSAHGHHRQPSSENGQKWVRELRTLPSDPNSKDFLKLEYLEVNLNNSRKLISNLVKLKDESDKYVEKLDTHVNGCSLQLHRAAKELDWLQLKQDSRNSPHSSHNNPS